jgi:hypothetical protein
MVSVGEGGAKEERRWALCSSRRRLTLALFRLAALEEHIEEINAGGAIAMKRKSKAINCLQSSSVLEGRESSATEGGSDRTSSSGPPPPPARGLVRQESAFGGFTDIAHWLKNLGLSEYARARPPPDFMRSPWFDFRYKKNFDNAPSITMSVIEEVGLSEKDLDDLFVREEFARRLILNSCKGGFSPSLEVDINGARDFGDVIVFRVRRAKRAASGASGERSELPPPCCEFCSLLQALLPLHAARRRLV